MTEEKILKDEMLSNGELEQIAGGTKEEYRDLANILPGVVIKPKMKNGAVWTKIIAMRYYEVKAWLKDNLNIDAVISDPEGSNKNVANIYVRNRKFLSHADVVKEVKNYLDL